MIVLLYGGNELEIRRRLQSLRSEADGGTGMIESNVNIVDGRDAKANDILAAAMSMPFLAPKRLVIVERAFERSQAGARRGGGRGEREPATPRGWEPLVAALEAGIPETTVLVFLGLPFGSGQNADAITPTNPLVTRLAKIAGVSNEHKAAIPEKELPQYVRERAAEYGVRLKPGKFPDRLLPGEQMPEESDPSVLIAALCQADTLSIANELQKLAFYSNRGEVTVAEVNRVCAGERTATEFQFRDAVLDGELAKAYAFSGRLLRDGGAIQGMLAILMGGYRSIGQIVDAVEDRLPAEEVGRLMGNVGRYPGLRDAQIRRARSLGTAGLRAAYEAMIEADRTSKAGEVDDEVGFDILLARLCELATPAAATRRR